MAFVWAAVAFSFHYPTPKLPLLPIASYIPTVSEMHLLILPGLFSPARLSASAPHLPTLHSRWLGPQGSSPTVFTPLPPPRLQPLREVLQAREALPYSHHRDLPVSAVPHPGESFLLKWTPRTLPLSLQIKGQPLRHFTSVAPV